MRAIRFRAFNVVRKEMNTVMSIEWHKGKVNRVTMRRTDVENILRDGWFDVGDHEIEKIVLLQSTGLMDKNGVEIYEGDILLAHDWGQKVRMRGIVIWQNFEWIVKANKRARTWVELTNLADGSCEFWEVIGNVHEQPYLLKAEGTP